MHINASTSTSTSSRRRLAGVTALLLATAALGACAGGTEAVDAARGDRPATTTTSAPAAVEGDDVQPPAGAPVTTPAPTAAPDDPETTPPTTIPADAPDAPAPTLDDGRHFGYLVGYELDSTATAASFDLAELLTGDDADRAAAEDGVIEPGQEVENDVYVRNRSPQLRRALFRDDARITVLDCTSGCSSVAADRATLQNRPTPTAVWLTVEGGVVVAADEVYLP